MSLQLRALEPPQHSWVAIKGWQLVPKHGPCVYLSHSAPIAMVVDVNHHSAAMKSGIVWENVLNDVIAEDALWV